MTRFIKFSFSGLFGFIALGCGGDGKPPAVETSVALLAFADCGELERYLQDTAVEQMRSQLEALKEDRSDPPVAFMGDAPATAEAAPSSFTTTNVQVPGVGEADFVQNDATRIFVLSGDTLYVNKSWPASELQLAATLKLEGRAREMLLDDKNRLTVFSEIEDASAKHPFAAARTKVTMVDVSDSAAPKATHEWYFSGAYGTARRIGSSIRLVTRQPFVWPEGVELYPQVHGLGEWHRDKILKQLMLKNERLIRKMSLSAWTGRQAQPSECNTFYHGNGSTQLGQVTLASIDLDAHAPAPQTTTVIGSPDVVYASATSLYIASSHWWTRFEEGQSTHTYVHKFDITAPGHSAYVASGGIEGHLLNSFSLDEAPNGDLRAATTITTFHSRPMAWTNWGDTKNRVVVYTQNGDQLVRVGQTEELAFGERIYSARFVGDKAFVVTFRQIDPLFTIDLSDPTQPKKVGELKIPGFSTYIHPLDDTYLLTWGTHIPEAGGAWGVKLALFDVSDLSRPKEAFTEVIEGAWGELYQHKGFTYFPERKWVAVPLYVGFTGEVHVYGVDVQTGFLPKGRLPMSGMEGPTYDAWSAAHRSVIADDYVYAISTGGIRVAEVNALSTPLKTVDFMP